ncbi:MAG: hypothetical protein GWO20_14365, partial [Candidatus Korarchaeota archaeon]|nr:hypothetical protein [Candidatus Korarchaeota archaeon]NIU84590.1 hypothetical protein [Candidatus Thorarchaeota archaeon]NIW14651.1 hypothetical protein [Candidatus Thorarchaeota archaeon]NIW52981.1 hypothetical protein [Candidatus Korarchaeota archaeon]
ANFTFLGQFTAKKKEVGEGEKKEIHSIVKRENNVLVKEGSTYLSETIPLYMKKERIVEEFQEVLFEKEGKPIFLTGGEFYNVTYNGEDERVIFL